MMRTMSVETRKMRPEKRPELVDLQSAWRTRALLPYLGPLKIIKSLSDQNLRYILIKGGPSRLDPQMKLTDVISLS